MTLKFEKLEMIITLSTLSENVHYSKNLYLKINYF